MLFSHSSNLTKVMLRLDYLQLFRDFGWRQIKALHHFRSTTTVPFWKVGSWKRCASYALKGQHFRTNFSTKYWWMPLPLEELSSWANTRRSAHKIHISQWMSVNLQRVPTQIVLPAVPRFVAKRRWSLVSSGWKVVTRIWLSQTITGSAFKKLPPQKIQKPKPVQVGQSPEACARILQPPLRPCLK